MEKIMSKRIVLGIGAGIAAYKSCELLRELQSQGMDVRVILTEAAHQFVSPLALQALSDHAVRSAMFDKDAERAMSHIELARWADYVLIAPATANILAQLAHGQANDLLSTVYLATEVPTIVCPAMNRVMWEHPATQENVKILKNRGVTIIDPDEGEQACKEVGKGRLPDFESIVDGIRYHSLRGVLREKHVLITAGPTYEAVDPVRFITNHSSGKMGYAIARAATMAGARVSLISGPTRLPKPKGVTYIPVQTAIEMQSRSMESLEVGSIVIGCAAVADYRPATIAEQKIKKNGDEMTLHLVKNPDVIKSLAEDGRPELIIGFAAETENVIEHAKLKRQAKGLDYIIANAVNDGKVFHQDENKVVLLGENLQKDFPLMSKWALARDLITFISKQIRGLEKS